MFCFSPRREPADYRKFLGRFGLTGTASLFFFFFFACVAFDNANLTHFRSLVCAIILKTGKTQLLKVAQLSGGQKVRSSGFDAKILFNLPFVLLTFHCCCLLLFVLPVAFGARRHLAPISGMYFHFHIHSLSSTHEHFARRTHDAAHAIPR
jgi:hypothetical protein